MERDFGRPLQAIKADGGASANSFLMQFQADIAKARVVLPEVAETTALGAAYLAGIASGYWSGLEDVARNWRKKREFAPAMDDETRKTLINRWERAIATAKGYR
jgi:glycerol kinase